MDLDDITKELDKAGKPGRLTERKPDYNVKQGKLKAYIMKLLAFALLIVIAGFGFLVVFNYKSLIMMLIVLVYLGLGIFLAFKLFSLTYAGWLYTLLLSAAGVFMPILALISRGFYNPALTMGALGVIALSLVSALLLWWAKDLFGIKSYREIFVPYK
jgi:magnesium-transporting ATPase (P-type)